MRAPRGGISAHFLGALLIALLLLTKEITPLAAARSTQAIRYHFEKITPPELEQQLLVDHKFLTKRSFTFEELTTSYVQSLVNDEIAQHRETLQRIGYWAPSIKSKITKQSDHYLVEVEIDPAALYKIVDLRLLDAETLAPLPMPSGAPNLGGAASAENILLFESEVLKSFLDQGHASASFQEKEVLIDDENQTVSILLKIDPGKRYYFGSISIEGLHETQEQFVRRRLLYAPRSLYSLSLIEQSEEQLLATSLFSQVRTETLEPQDQQIPLVIHLKEGKSKSLALGFKIATDATRGYRGEWQNRNFSGMGDLIALRAHNSYDETKLLLHYAKPDFFSNGTFLRTSFEYSNNNPKAYREEKWELSCLFEKRPFSRILLRYGLMGSYVLGESGQNQTRAFLLSAPLSATWSSALPINLPRSGRTHALHVEPHHSLSKSNVNFFKVELKNSFYFPLDTNLTLALGANIGSLVGSGRDEIPPSTRYYLGGDQALRGYPHQSVAPLDLNGDLQGGRCFCLGSIEPRFQLSKGFYFAPFFDIGQVSLTAKPSFEEEFIYSWGVGWHLDTLVGPLRLDIAFPLSPRNLNDPRYQVYLSIGAAF